MLQSLNVAKASGQDGISARMLKATAVEIAPSIAKLFNVSIQSGRPPAAWKSANVVPIPKKQGAKSPNEFRPISLLPVISKVPEKHLHFLISDHVSEHCPLSDCQWGFQAGKSTVAALLSTTQDWFQLLGKGKEVEAVFFDFQKAFDTVPHQPLIDKLCKLGLNPQIVKWVRNYLTNRSQKVVVNGVLSLPMRVASGVSQGSILVPLLFLIFIDDISGVNISDGSKIVLYADDILLYRPITSPEDLQHLQHDVDKLQAYATTNYMKFNESKCKFMLVSRKKRHIDPVPSIHLNGSPLQNIPTFKYLGLIISSDLCWSSHIDNICSKAKRILGLIYRRFYRHSNEQTLRQLYLSIVRPHLEYATQVWSPYMHKDIMMLERTQLFACKMCTRTWDSSYDELLKRLHLLTLEQRRLHLSLCFMYRG